ncbi:MAG: FkbM family methyltransferase, partial [archaeon]|nr:FkbM family methyltransferase [archaeon]
RKKQEIKFNIQKDPQLSGIIGNDTDNKIGETFILRKTKTLFEILEKYKAPKIIDYFSFDVEGAETRIFKNFPFDKFIFLLINIERPSKLLTDILKRNGYICIGGNPCDRYFIYKKFFSSFSFFKKLEIIFISNIQRIFRKI